ncbi:hypothetical protein P3S68_030234 [Capsicum galapagoense]
MYASIERCPIVQKFTDNEFDLCDTSHLSNLNIDSSRDIVQHQRVGEFDRHSNDISNLNTQCGGWVDMQYDNSDGNVHNFDIGGSSNAHMHIENLNSNHQQHSFPLESIDECNGFEGTLTRFTQIVKNNDDVADNGVCGSDNDEPSEHESMDDVETSDDDNIIGEDAALVARSVSHPSIEIPYLDNTEESTEDFVYTCDDSFNQAALWNLKNLEFIQTG